MKTMTNRTWGYLHGHKVRWARNITWAKVLGIPRSEIRLASELGELKTTKRWGSSIGFSREHIKEWLIKTGRI